MFLLIRASAYLFHLLQTEQICICSKSTIETLQKVCNMFKINKKKHQNDAIDVVVSLLLRWNTFHTFSSASVVDFEHLFAGNILLFNLI